MNVPILKIRDALRFGKNRQKDYYLVVGRLVCGQQK